MKRTLSLKREALTPLSAGDLAGIAGAALPTSPVGYCVDSWLVCFSADPPNSQCFCPTEV